MSTSAAQPIAMERRRFLRFPAHVRVAFDLAGRWSIAGTQDLSQGGMALASGPGACPAQGTQATFVLHLPDGDRPQPALGEVLGVTRDVSHVRFASGQRELVERVRRYAEIVVVPSLESSLSDAVHDRNRLVALAGLYHELGRDTQALDLYHAALDLGATNRDFLEAVAPAMLQQVRPFGTRGATLLAQLRSSVAKALTESPSPTLEAVARSLDTSQVVVTEPEGIEMVPALPEHEIAKLRESIRHNREQLYKGFLQLLEERNRLRRLEQAAPAASGLPAEHDVMPLLTSIRSQLESLKDQPAEAQRPAPAAAPVPAMAPAPAVTVGASPDITLVAAPVIVAGPPPPARAPSSLVPARLPAPTITPARPVRRRPGSALTAVVVGVLLVGGIAVALWITRPSPEAIESARRAKAAAMTPVEVRPATAPGAATVVEPAATGSETPATTGAEPPATSTRPSRAERAGRNRAPPVRAGRDTAAQSLPPEPPPPPPPSQALVRADARANAHIELALRHLKERKVTLAVQEARAGLADEPGNATAYRILGTAYGMLGEEAQSLAAFERFLELAPDDPAAERVRATLRKHRPTAPPR